ncbi:carboxymuconolactone decarboxylase [Streptomyces sp. G45]|uniref:carboxymuconolactone decarboxylase n=1 Tax=Streptomyces sp. G45 TaxID=3406627 RepID=UPI003C141E95
MRGLLATSLRGGLVRIRHVTAVRPEEAHGTVAAVYRQTERDFGALAPPVALHSPAPGVLAAAWAMLRETLLVEAAASRAAKEAVATGVSEANTCPYCVQIHGAALSGLDRGGRDGPAFAWARGSGPDASAGAAPPPCAPAAVPELVGVAVAFHYLNRMVNVFLDDSPLPATTPAAARGPVLRIVTRSLRAQSARAPAPGDSLPLLPAAPPPADLAWAAGKAHIEGAFARAAAAVDAAGARAVPAAVRDLVLAELADWDGRPPGMARTWLEDRVRPLPAGTRPAARLALLTALASYQVSPADIDAVRDTVDGPADQRLVELTSWAALAAARRAGTRLARPR